MKQDYFKIGKKVITDDFGLTQLISKLLTKSSWVLTIKLKGNQLVKNSQIRANL